MTNSQTQTPLYLNLHLGTDVFPFEVVRVISEKTVEIREMSAALDPEWKPDFVQGGFFGHTRNNGSQRYLFSRNADAPILRARLTKRGVWSVQGNAQYVASDSPRRFNDYNF